VRGLSSRGNNDGAPLKAGAPRVRPVLGQKGTGGAKSKRLRAALGDITNKRPAAAAADGNAAKKHNGGKKGMTNKKLLQAAPQSAVSSASSAIAEDVDDLCAPLEFVHGSFQLSPFEDDLGVDGLAADVKALANMSTSEFLSQSSTMSPMKYDADCCATFDLADIDDVNFDDFEL
jgi:hypothetical protein